MNRGRVVLAACLGLIMTLLPAPYAAAGGRLHAGRGFSSHRSFSRGLSSRSLSSHRFSHRHVAPRRRFHRPFGGRRPAPFVPFGAFVSPVVVYSAPSAVYVPVYTPPATYEVPAVTVAPAPPPPPVPSVVYYPHGRYELRGDGVMSPYTWVWVPNPPSPPLPPPPPAAPPTEPPTSSETPAPEPTRVYRWTDDEGVIHLTDRWEAVPRRYRREVERAEPS